MDHDAKQNIAVLWVQAQPAVSAFIASVVTDFYAADDILQNVALVTTRRIDEYDSKRPFAAWAIGIAKNEILSYYRSQKKEHRLLDTLAIESLTQTFTQQNPEIALMKKSMERALRTCLQKLGEKWRYMIELFYLRDMDTQRIAQQLVMSHGNVRVTLHRIRRALRACVDQQLPPEAS